MTNNGRSINTKLYDLVQGIKENALHPDIVRDNTNEILRLLEPILHKIIKRNFLAMERWDSQDVDDIMQQARIGIWRAIAHVDLDQPNSVRGFLVVAAKNNAISFVRKELRRQRSEFVGLPEEAWGIVQPEQIMYLDLDDNDLLAMYLDYIKWSGGFKGAHDHVASLIKVKKYKLKQMVQKRAAALSKTLDIAKRLGMKRRPDGTSIFDD